MNPSGPSLEAAATTVSATTSVPDAHAATPVLGSTLARRNSQRPPSLTGLKFLNELLGDHHDNEDDL
ncbi:hypothetical protein BGZ65_006521, partial [Modicella reniformis]